MAVIILTPVYKSVHVLNEFEILSISNNLKKNKEDLLFLFGPQKFKAEYENFFQRLKYICFKDKYFKSVNSYNRLLLSNNFYERFKNYSHILISQTDSWIFGNEGDLLKFLDFDYCGAPSFEYGNLNGYNGGLSLRSVKRSIEALKKFRNYESSSAIIQRHLKSSKIYQVILYKWLSIILDLLIRKRIMWPFNYFYKGNEDLFWSVEVPKAFPEFNVIDYNSSLAFSWEHNCDNFITEYSLPFGCHGWWNYNYNFWKKIIKLDSEVKN